MSVLKVFTDGGSKGNPGPATIGGVFYFNNKPIFKFSKSIGLATNNVAEYQAVVYALEKIKKNSILKKFSITNIEFYSDSSLLVNQINGLFKVKNKKIRDYLLKIRLLEEEFNLPITYHLIPREKNKEADQLVNLANN